MEKRFEQIENFLKEIAKEVANKPENIEDGIYEIYNRLARFGLSVNDRIFKNEDEEYLKDNPDYNFEKIKREAQTCGDKWIKLVQWDKISSYSWILKQKTENFIYIRRSDVNENIREFNEIDSIKLYIPLGKQGVTKIIQLLLIMMEEHQLDIKHDSKVSATIRTDDFVIRVNSIEEAEKIINYLNCNNEYSELLIQPNPFVIRKGNIGLAADGALSYNYNVADYINQYMQDLKKKGQLSTVSREGFIKFLTSKYDLLFKKGEFKEEYRRDEYHARKCDYLEKWLMNRMKIADLILIALEPQSTIETFYEHWRDINDEEYNEKLEEYFYELARGRKTDMPLKPSQIVKTLKEEIEQDER